MSKECCGPPDTADTGPEAGHLEQAERLPWWKDMALIPSMISGLALLAGFAFEWNGADTLALALHWVALLAGTSTFAPDAVRRLARGSVGVGLLMTIAAIGAVALGHVGEAAALAFLFSLAEALEDRAMDRAKGGLRALLSLIPETARVSRDNNDQTIAITDVRVGDTLIIGAGERIATDGIVMSGQSSIDVSAVTGESIPVAALPGDPVPAGAINGSATLRVEATADGRDNSLTHIVSLVEQAHKRKGGRARLADRIARPLVPAVMVVAIAVVAYGFLIGEPGLWFERALVVLVAASPCALAIAVPVTVISSIGAASRFGVVIKSGHAFEQFGAVQTVAFDKTGTLTNNAPRVIEVISETYSQEQLVNYAAALEASSSHPLAEAITAAATASIIAMNVTEVAGRGITGSVDGHVVRVGGIRWSRADDVSDSALRLADQGMTVVAVDVDVDHAGIIGIRDELRPETAETIDMLKAQGIRSVMITGDSEATAHALAFEAGIIDVRAEQLPTDKAAVIESLAQESTTAMVGDGINDAPALATATVGIAMGVGGSAAAIESADVAFTGRDLRLIPQALAHARRGRNIMAWNIGLSLAIIVGLFPLALFGVLGLAGVVLIHEIAEVLVILNGVRAARHRQHQLTSP